jgi:ADP-heptose:LPS heptosyltransferase
MSVPAIRALKESLSCKITLLTSPAAAEAVACIPEIDDHIAFNAPWNRLNTLSTDTLNLITRLREGAYDAAIVFTVYSQNPLPAAMLAFLAEIPRRLAYCRENPYGLLTDWLPDEEPYFYIKHQVERDLDLVKSIGAVCENDHLRVRYSTLAWGEAEKQLDKAGVNKEFPWIIFHPGVSEKRREVPLEYWIEAGKKIKARTGLNIVVTGNRIQRETAEEICHRIGKDAFSLAGLLKFDEFVALIDHSSLVISVNTVTVHIAAATGVPVVVLYALTNPQHTPWKAPSKVLTFHPRNEVRSKNTVVGYVYESLLKDIPDSVYPDKIVEAVIDLMAEPTIRSRH